MNPQSGQFELLKIQSAADLLAGVISHWDEPNSLIDQIFNGLMEIFPADVYYAHLWPSRKPSREVYLHPETWVHPDCYRSAATIRMLDPLRAEIANQHYDAFSLQQIIPDGFRDSEYYRLVYEDNAIIDELVFALPLPHPEPEGDTNPDELPGAFIIGLARKHSLGIFTRRELRIASSLYRALRSAGPQLAKIGTEADFANTQLTTTPIDLRDCLSRFVQRSLTPRESQVIQLVIRGHNTESASVQLGIACDTVKLHRKHAYSKLKVKSQGELFTKFLDYLGEDIDRGKVSIPLLSGE